MLEKISLGIDNIGMHLRDFGFMLHTPDYFHETSPKEKIEKFIMLLKKTKYTLTKVKNSEWNVSSEYNSKIRTAKIFIHNSYDKNKPTIIYHHGAGQFNYANMLRKGLGENFWNKYNVFSIKAQHHNDIKDYLSNCMNSFLNWQLTFAGSVQAMEEIVRFHKNRNRNPIISIGTSMGGIVTSLHFLVFNSADIYFPIVAYPNVGEIFLGRAYKYAVNKLNERRKNRSYFDSFSFENNFSEDNKKKIYPILAKHDWYIDFEKAAMFWKGYDVEVYNLGHRSIIVKLDEIHRYIENKSTNKATL
jgi:hypothetical protein